MPLAMCTQTCLPIRPQQVLIFADRKVDATDEGRSCYALCRTWVRNGEKSKYEEEQASGSGARERRRHGRRCRGRRRRRRVGAVQQAIILEPLAGRGRRGGQSIIRGRHGRRSGLGNPPLPLLIRGAAGPGVGCEGTASQFTSPLALSTHRTVHSSSVLLASCFLTASYSSGAPLAWSEE